MGTPTLSLTETCTCRTYYCAQQQHISRMRWVTLSVGVILAGTVTTTYAQGNILTNFLNSFDSRDNYEGAPYQVVKSTGQYEERNYPAKKWVCTEQQGRAGDDISNGMFMKLFRYISGGNAQGEKTKSYTILLRTGGEQSSKLFRYISGGNVQEESIKMTVPVSTQVSRDASTQTVTHRMCFYIGEIHQTNPPQPNDPQVFIENRQPITIFTRQVPGYMDDNDWDNEIIALRGILTSAGESFVPTPYWRVGYDSPMKFWDRRNEIWFSKN